jgi:threonine dehydrogenase-like Zn-dependent dehydrogenase
MKALTWHGKEDMRIDTVSDPRIEEPGDIIIGVTATAICGSDLHIYDGFLPKWNLAISSVSWRNTRTAKHVFTFDIAEVSEPRQNARKKSFSVPGDLGREIRLPASPAAARAPPAATRPPRRRAA